jgi:hypothetical protein
MSLQGDIIKEFQQLSRGTEEKLPGMPKLPKTAEIENQG